MPETPSDPAPADARALPRRDVLRLAATIPAIYGLSALLACHGDGVGGRRGDRAPRNPADTPDWWPTFLRRSKDADHPEVTVVVRIPADAGARRALGTILVNLVDHGSAEERLLTSIVRIGCLSDAQMKALVVTAKPDDAFVRVDAEARRVDGLAVPASDLGDLAKVKGAIETVAFGPSRERLAAAAKAARSRASAADLERFDHLHVGDPATVEKNVREARSLVYALAPTILFELRGPADPTRRAALERAVIVETSENHSALHSAFRMPDGVGTDAEGGGCGGAGVNGATIACGMAMPTPGSYRFLQFLVDA